MRDVSAGWTASKQGGAGPSRRWWALASVVLAQLMVTLDGTVVTIALPAAQSDLGFSNGDRQWIITGYMLAFGALLLAGGRVSDLIGRKRTFLIALAGFAAASAVGGAANSFTMLVTARVVQGAAGALLAPTALAVLTTTFTAPRERSRAFGVFSAASSSGVAIGLLLGGILTQDLSWRWTLYINVIIAVVAAAGAAVFVDRVPVQEPRPRLDVLGTLLVSAGLFAVVLGFAEAETDGWGSPLCWAPLAASAVLLAAFAAWQQRAAQPLLPLGLLLHRDRGAAFAGMLLASAGMAGVLLFVSYYLQGSLHYTPIATGLAFLPLVAVLILAAQLASNVFLPRFGQKIVVPCGMIVAAAGMAMLTRLGVHASYAADILPALLLIGLGIGNVITSSFQAGTLAVDPSFAGVAAATVNTSQQAGGSIGTALLNTVAVATSSSYLRAHLPGTSAITARAVVHGYATAYWWGAACYLFGALLTALLYRRRYADARRPRTGQTAGAAETASNSYALRPCHERTNQKT
jgi:EmrB/QacA subfamily drug resistance transporter